MAMAGTCAHQSPESLAPVAQRFASAAPAVRGMAPMAYLRLSDCTKDDKGHAPPRARAISVIEARLADTKDKEILGLLGLVGEAAHPLVPALLARQKTMPDQLAGVLTALGAIGPAAHPAVPTLVALLRDKHKEAWRHLTLRALARIGPSAGETKQEALEVLSADAYLLDDVASVLSSSFGNQFVDGASSPPAPNAPNRPGIEIRRAGGPARRQRQHRRQARWAAP
jgi:hypothetical protein